MTQSLSRCSSVCWWPCSILATLTSRFRTGSRRPDLLDACEPVPAEPRETVLPTPTEPRGTVLPTPTEPRGTVLPTPTEPRGTALPIPTEHVVGQPGNGSHTLRGERFHRPQRIMPSANNHRVKWADWDWPVPTVFANGSTAGLVRDCRRDHAAGRQSANPKQSAYMTRVVIPMR